DLRSPLPVGGIPKPQVGKDSVKDQYPLGKDKYAQLQTRLFRAATAKSLHHANTKYPITRIGGDVSKTRRARLLSASRS
ncbi:MAG: hypothetical protein Q4C87_09590, partial [Actinomycetaceae bacterium]|nr:hypothetical protein [Actinomycetaceae bacterium]